MSDALSDDGHGFWRFCPRDVSAFSLVCGFDCILLIPQPSNPCPPIKWSYLTVVGRFDCILLIPQPSNPCPPIKWSYLTVVGRFDCILLIPQPSNPCPPIKWSYLTVVGRFDCILLIPQPSNPCPPINPFSALPRASLGVKWWPCVPMPRASLGVILSSIFYYKMGNNWFGNSTEYYSSVFPLTRTAFVWKTAKFFLMNFIHPSDREKITK